MLSDPSQLPRHVAIIMDGNGRWAQRRGLPRVEGHRRGAVAVRDVVRAAREIGLNAITLYAFSAQNWDRPPEEVATLMQLLRDYVIDERDEIMENDIRLIAIGDIDRLPDFVKAPLDSLMAESAGNRSMTLCLALSYGGRESLVAAAQKLAADVARGALEAGDITEQHITDALQTNGLPRLDLLVRTSGEERLSNSCSGRRPTPSCTSPRPSGRTSARPSYSPRSSPTASASAASAAPASRSGAPARRHLHCVESRAQGRLERDRPATAGPGQIGRAHV
jgi:undecaprenyl diphosphate synthase